ncbi:MAG: phenylalanine--tRNA ligase subunit beta, partial [Robiginitomaculum sp.]|nr:phenylalanine--tRNA ligase subunit beta [Robiginitomaculum sp.]
AIGLRPISALVDMTNLMSYDFDRPLHVYDMAKLSGAITARLGAFDKTRENREVGGPDRDATFISDDPDTFLALDGKWYDATNQMCVIADDSGAIGLGGVMGGNSTAVDENTRDVFIECALFNAQTTMQTGRDTGITSDARYRFERGVDSGFVLDGIELATKLVMDWCGGEPSEVSLAGEIPKPPASINFEMSQVKRLTGLDLQTQQITDILQKLGFVCGSVENGKMPITVPSWRRDVTASADLVEEIVRIHGFDKLPMVSLVRAPGTLPNKPPLAQTRAKLLRYALAGIGFNECVTWSFCSRSHAKVFGGGADELVLANPISSELDVMRPSALIHLLLAAQRNADRGQNGLSLFEVGPVYRGDAPEDQALSAAGIITPDTSRHWQGAKQADLFVVKAAALHALEAAGVKVANLQTATNTSSYWHPGRSGALRLGPKNTLAEFGELHPSVLKTLGVEGPVYGFEVWQDNIPKPRSVKIGRAALTSHKLQVVTRDFAFIVTDDIAADALVRSAKSADKKLISAVDIFDVYAGKGIEDGHKSLAIEVSLQPVEQTLSEAEIEAVSQKIIAKVQSATGGVLRA